MDYDESIIKMCKFYEKLKMGKQYIFTLSMWVFYIHAWRSMVLLKINSELTLNSQHI